MKHSFFKSRQHGCATFPCLCSEASDLLVGVSAAAKVCHDQIHGATHRPEQTWRQKQTLRFMLSDC